MNTRPGSVSKILSALLAALMLGIASPATAAEPGECVILLHGLGRTPLSMLPLKFALDRAGYRTVNQGYPSLALPIEELAATHVPEALAKCAAPPGAPVHFVTHSMGGILVRHYLQDNRLPDGSRMVMLGPPNHIVLNAIEAGAQYFDTRQQLWFGLAPAISSVREFTDGDETSHLVARLGKLLLRFDPS